jgi:hypothetical protein
LYASRQTTEYIPSAIDLDPKSDHSLEASHSGEQEAANPDVSFCFCWEVSVPRSSYDAAACHGGNTETEFDHVMILVE